MAEKPRSRRFDYHDLVLWGAYSFGFLMGSMEPRSPGKRIVVLLLAALAMSVLSRLGERWRAARAGPGTGPGP